MLEEALASKQVDHYGRPAAHPVSSLQIPVLQVPAALTLASPRIYALLHADGRRLFMAVWHSLKSGFI